MGLRLANLKPNFKIPNSELTVIKFSHSDSNWNKHYLCSCSCGNTKTFFGSALVSGITRSCGCLKYANCKSKIILSDLVPGFRVPDSNITIIDFKGSKSKYRTKYYKALCDCGTEFTAQGTHITSGHTKSCGCIARSANGNSRTKEYNSLRGAISRCYNPNNKKYKNYGVRGITVSERYRGADGVDNLIQDIGTKPGPEFSLDRIDNDGNYCPGNLQWSNPKQQAGHKTTSRMITYKDETLTLEEWSQRTGILSDTIAHRLKRGWSTEKALEAGLYDTAKKYIEFNGQTKSLSEWAKLTGIPTPNLLYRIKAGWSIDKAFTVPTHQYNKRT